MLWLSNDLYAYLIIMMKNGAVYLMQDYYVQELDKQANNYIIFIPCF